MRQPPLPTLPPGTARSRSGTWPFKCPLFTPTSKRKRTPRHSRPEKWVQSRTSHLVLFSSLGVWSQGPGSHQWPVRGCKEAWGLSTQASTFEGMLGLRRLAFPPKVSMSAWQPEACKCPLGSLAHSSLQIYSQPLATSVNSWWRRPPLPRPLYPHLGNPDTPGNYGNSLCASMCTWAPSPAQGRASGRRFEKGWGPWRSLEKPRWVGSWLGREQSGLRLPPSGHPENHRRTSLPSNQAAWTEGPSPLKSGKEAHLLCSTPLFKRLIKQTPKKEMISDIGLVP